MEVDDKDADYSEVMNDPDFLQSVLQVRVLLFFLGGGGTPQKAGPCNTYCYF